MWRSIWFALLLTMVNVTAQSSSVFEWRQQSSGDWDCYSVSERRYVSPSDCDDAGLNRPTPTAAPTRYQYIPGNWSTCSTTCPETEGVQTRLSMQCFDSLIGTMVSVNMCSAAGLPYPSTARSCFHTCNTTTPTTATPTSTTTIPTITPTISPTTIPTSPSSQSGYEWRNTSTGWSCYGKSDWRYVSPSDCDDAGLTRPTPTPTSAPTRYQYIPGSWSTCWGTCPSAMGGQTRLDMQCYDSLSGTMVSVNMCSEAGLPYPSTARSCFYPCNTTPTPTPKPTPTPYTTAPPRPTTTIPTSGPSTTIPTSYPYPDPEENNGMPFPTLSNKERAFIIAYPVGVVLGAVIILLIVGCCLKRRTLSTAPDATSTSTSTSTSTPVPSVPRLRRVVLFWSSISLILLIVSISLRKFSYIELNNPYSIIYPWAYGPFQVNQPGEQTMVWMMPVKKTAEIASPFTGACMIISMITSFAMIGYIKNRSIIITSRILFVSLIGFLFSLCAILIWIPVHVRLQDYRLANDIMLWQNNNYYFPYTHHYSIPQASLGVGYILLIITTAVQLILVITMIIIHNKYANHNNNVSAEVSSTPQPEQDGLQLVQPTSPYYYRDVPHIAQPSIAPAYIYGVVPSAPPPFISTGYPSAAPTYHPAPPPFISPDDPSAAPTYHPALPVVEPLHQHILPAPVLAPAPTPAPGPVAAGYPELCVEVPASGPWIAYQRLL